MADYWSVSWSARWMINRLDIADPLSGLLLLQIVITILTRPNQYVYMDPKTYANLSIDPNPKSNPTHPVS